MSGLAGLSQLVDTASKKPRPDRDPNWYAHSSAMIGEQLVTFRFRAIDPEEWARRTFESSPQKDVPNDQTFRFNVREVSKDVAMISGALVDEDGTEEHVPLELWEQLWPVLSGPDRNDIIDTVFGLNHATPALATIAAKKARLLTLAQSADSPASSESRPDDSADGSPEKSSTSSETSSDASAGSSSPAKPSGTTSRSQRSSRQPKKTGTGDTTASR